VSAKRPRVSLFIATAPRSGSWLLAEGLRSLDVAGRAEEFFRIDLESTYRERWGLGPSASYADFLQRAIAQGQTANGVFAAKVHWFQFAHLLRRLRAIHGRSSQGSDQPVGDVELLENHFGPFRMVYLERSDTLRQAISWQRAMRTDVWWNVPGTTRRPGPTSGEYDFDGIKHLYYLLQDYKAYWRAWFAHHEVTPVEITYEALAADYHSSLTDVVSELGLPLPELVPTPFLRRQADGQTEAWARAYEQSWIRVFGDQLR
jgi:LPS sulfotransferase NodH